MNKLKYPSVLATFLVVSLLFSGLNAEAQNPGVYSKNIAKKGFSQLFVYDPENSGTVSASYVNKFSRLSALLTQPHTVPRTACGFLIRDMGGLPLSTATYHIDVSTDTKFSNKANIILFGIDRNNQAREHRAPGLNFDSSTPSDPGWRTYNYSAIDFSPPIGSDETFFTLAISLFGGDEKNPDHFDHWLSRPVINGVQVRQLVENPINLINGRLVGF